MATVICSAHVYQWLITNSLDIGNPVTLLGFCVTEKPHFCGFFFLRFMMGEMKETLSIFDCNILLNDF